MNQLRDPNHAPPGGWRYVDPDSKFHYDEEYTSLEHLLEHIRAYRQQNKWEPLENLQLKVECWLCKQPDMKPYCRNVKRLVREYLSGAVAGIEMAIRGEKSFVSQEEAERRAAICVHCPLNRVNQDHSVTRRYTDKAMETLVGDRHTPHDEKLFSCIVCTCVLKAKVHVASDIILSKMDRKTLEGFPDGDIIGTDGKPVHCWQKHLKE